jgi:hypothetical protein
MTDDIRIPFEELAPDPYADVAEVYGEETSAARIGYQVIDGVRLRTVRSTQGRGV